ncbi:hypothetical protein ES319_D02G089400v1, partial [Gossypium barbadense]
VPTGEVVSLGDDNFIKFEDVGVKEAKNAAFVLIAGGFGERLGYNGSKSILVHQEASSWLTQGTCQKEIPFVIMTSDDTHARTVDLLESNSYFGMKASQVKLLKQAIPASLGVSAPKEYHANSLVVPRKAKEAIRGITKLTHSDDVNCETGYSPFPGNINQLILELGPYIKELTKTGGTIKEFVNPKRKRVNMSSVLPYVTAGIKMLVKHHLNYPKTLPPSARVGFTVMDTWLAYAPVKNNPEDAAKVPKGNPYHSATSGEMVIYLILKKAGVQVEVPVQQAFNGQEVEVNAPPIQTHPKWGIIKSKVSGSCSISLRSTMALKGRDILDGVLIINSTDGAEVKVGGSIKNKGWLIERIDYKDTAFPEKLRIRGFRMEETYSQPVKYTLKP